MSSQRPSGGRRLTWSAWVILVAFTLAAESSAPAQNGPGRGFAERLRSGPGVSNHPVGVIPSSAVRIPTGWPLDKNGAITCLTCHTALPSLEHATEFLLRDFDERQPDPVEFCAKCHSSPGPRDTASLHWIALGRAHIAADESHTARSGDSLDSHTTQCLGCHDGVSAGESLNQTPWNSGPGYRGDRQRNHPVGVSYPSRTPRDFSVSFRPVSLLPEQVQLPGGKVSCVSCHNLYADNEHLLTIPNTGSDLCFTCHDLR